MSCQCENCACHTPTQETVPHVVDWKMNNELHDTLGMLILGTISFILLFLLQRSHARNLELMQRLMEK